MEHEITMDAAHRRHHPRSPEHPINRDSEAVNIDYQTMDHDNDEEMYGTLSPPREESHTRSLVKGLTWRILATSTTTIIAFIVTGHVEAALQIGFFEFFAKLMIYYIHERIWTRIRL